MRAQPVADHLLPPADGGLGPGSSRVSGRFLPSHAPVLGDVPEMAVALRRLALGRPAGHGGRARRHDHGRLGVARGDAGVDAVLVVRTVGGERGDGSGTVRNSVYGRAVEPQPARAFVKRSPKRTANW